MRCVCAYAETLSGCAQSVCLDVTSYRMKLWQILYRASEIFCGSRVWNSVGSSLERLILPMNGSCGLVPEMEMSRACAIWFLSSAKSDATSSLFPLIAVLLRR